MKKLNLLRLGFLIAILFGASAMFAQSDWKTTIQPPEPYSEQGGICDVYLVDITAENYYSVGAISFTIEYDANLLLPLGIEPGSVNDLFNVDPGFSVLPNSRMKISWNGGGHSDNIYAEEVLFQLKFEVLQRPVAPATIVTGLTWTVDGSMEINEVAGPNGSPAYPDNFNVNGGWTIMPNLEATATPIHVTCLYPENGQITLDVDFGYAPYFFNWDGPNDFTSIDEDLVAPGYALEAGVYTLIITDSHYCKLFVEVTVLHGDVPLPVIDEDPGAETIYCKNEIVAPEEIPNIPIAIACDDKEIEYDHFVVTTSWEYDVIGDCEGWVVYTYYYYDDYAPVPQVVTWTYTYTIVKSPLETIGDQIGLLPPVIYETVTCPTEVCCATAPIAFDDCGLELWPVNSNCSVVQIPCFGEVVYSYVYEYCGQDYTWTHTYNIVREELADNMPDNAETTIFCLSDLPSYDEYEDDWDIDPIEIMFCDVVIPPLDDEPVVTGLEQFYCEGTVTFTWGYEDCAGSPASWSHVFVIDMPEYELPEGDFYGEEIACAILALDPPELPEEFVDYCENSLIIISQTQLDELPTGNGTVEWKTVLNDCTDELSHERIWYFTYTIIQENFEMPEPMTTPIACLSDIPEFPYHPIELLDACLQPLEIVGEDINFSDPLTTCEGWVEYEWSYEDAAGNINVWTHTFVITPEDFDMPFNPNPKWVTIECAGDFDATLEENTPGGIPNNCGTYMIPPSDPVMLEIEGTYPIECEGTIKYTWTYNDCNFSHDYVLYIVVDDKTAPQMFAPEDITVYLNDGCLAKGFGLGVYNATDNCEVVSVCNDLPLMGLPEGDHTITWTAKDCSGLTGTDTQIVHVEFNTISGTVEYFNIDFQPNTSLEFVDVYIYDPSNLYSPIGYDQTDEFGNYAFEGLCEGDFVVKVDPYQAFGLAPGGVNATDAAQTSKIFADGGIGVEYVRWLTADAVEDCNVFITDAARIVQHFMTEGNPAFKPYYWNFWLAGDINTVNTCPVNMNIYVGPGTANQQDFLAMCEGDVNGSYLKSGLKSGSESLSLEYGDYQQVNSDVAFELPLNAGMDMEVGAISLVMNFPANEVEITGVFLTSDPSSDLMYNVSGDELRIAWYSSDAIWVNEGESLITLQLNNVTSADGIEFILIDDPLNEIADGDYEVIGGAKLLIDIPSTSALGFGQNSAFAENIEFSNYPNPFVGYTTLTYSIPADGEVILEVYDIIGNKVKVAVDETQSAGNYTHKLDANTLQPGIYTAILKYKTNNKEVVRAIKMIRK